MRRKNPNAIRLARQDVWFSILNYILLGFASLLVLYPLWYVVIASVSDPDLINRGGLIFLPQGFHLEGYNRAFQDAALWTGYRNTILYTAIGTAINLAITLPGAYALSLPGLPGRGPLSLLFAFTMFFSGGMVPTYLLVNALGLIDTLWAMVLPGALSVYNLIVARTFFATSLPQELSESALIDGCSRIRFFLRIALPLSTPIIAVLTIFYSTTHWNAFMNALFYIRSADKQPLQVYLRNLLILSQMQTGLIADDDTYEAIRRMAGIMKYTVIIVANLPVLLLYPLLQRYFLKGVMIGALKG